MSVSCRITSTVRLKMTLIEIRDLVFPIGIAFVCFHFAGKKKWPWLSILGALLLAVGVMNAIRFSIGS